MRKLMWTVVLILPLIAAGGLVYAHTGSNKTPAVAGQRVDCPLDQLHRTVHKTLIGIGALDGAGKKPFCPLQWLIKQLHS